MAGFLPDLIYLTSLILISWPKWIFRHEGLVAVRRDGIWSRGADIFSWLKSPSLSHGQPEGLRFGIVLLELVSRPLCWGLPSRLCGSVAEIISSLSKHCDSLGRDLPLSFAGICALSHWHDILFHRTSKFYMPVCFLCQICPSYGYDYSHIESDFARLSYRYDNHHLDFSWIYLGLFSDTIRLIWPLPLSPLSPLFHHAMLILFLWMCQRLLLMLLFIFAVIYFPLPILAVFVCK